MQAFEGIKGIEIIVPDKELTGGGLVKNDDDSEKVIEMFAQERLDGLILGVLGYGDEKSALAIVEEYPTLPLLFFAMHEPIPDGTFFEGASICGAIPISFGLHRRKKKFTFAGVFNPEDKALQDALNSFKRVCLAVKRFRKARVGMIGLRPSDFEICVVNEGLMIERYQQKIIPFNLLNLKYDLEKLADDDERVVTILNEITSDFQSDFDTQDVVKLAKLELVMRQYAQEQRLDAFTIQCWTAILEYIGVSPCLVNGRLTGMGIPVSCEGDVMGALTMLLQHELSFERQFPMFADILMLHPDEDNLFLAWHCGNAPVKVCAEGSPARLRPHCAFASTFGEKNTLATAEFMFAPGKITVNRLVEHDGVYKMLNFEGSFVQRDTKLPGGWGWVEVENRDAMIRTAVEEGFTHHVALIHATLSNEVQELCKYLDIDYVEG